VTASVSASFEVTNSYGISASALTPFASAQAGYATAPALQTVTITNNGTGSVTLTQPSANANYDIGTLSKTLLAAKETATFTVRPKTGLAVGTHNETITVNGTNGVTASVSASFEVTNSYGISASPTTAAFASAVSGYTQSPAAQTVTITNNGTGSVTLTQPAANAKYDIGNLSTTLLATNGKATFTVRPKTGLAVGTHNETITVSGTNGVSASVSASFEVTNSYGISASALTPFASAVSGYTQSPAAQTVTITNNGTGSVTLTQPVSTNYDIGNLSTTLLAANGKATFTVRPKTGDRKSTRLDSSHYSRTRVPSAA
jgi:hypothetical protein